MWVVYLKTRKFVIVNVHTKDEIEASVPLVDDLKVFELEEVGLFGVPHNYHPVNLGLQFDLLVVVVVHVPFG